MKIDVTPIIEDWDGTPFRPLVRPCPMCGRGQEVSPILTLRSCCLAALGATLPQDREAPIEDKMERNDLGMRIYKAAKMVELTAAEIVVLQERTNAFYLSAIIAPQLHRLLEPSEGKV